MTVRELVAFLQHVPDQNRIVILAKDGEGNGFSPLDGIESRSQYRAGEVGLVTGRVQPSPARGWMGAALSVGCPRFESSARQ